MSLRSQFYHKQYVACYDFHLAGETGTLPENYCVRDVPTTNHLFQRYASAFSLLLVETIFNRFSPPRRVPSPNLNSLPYLPPPARPLPQLGVYPLAH